MSLATLTGATTVSATSLAQMLNRILIGQLPSALNQLALGQMLRQQMPITLRRCNPVIAATAPIPNPYFVAGQSVAENTVANPAGPGGSGGSAPLVPTAASVTPGANILGQLPDDAKCLSIVRAVPVAGTGTLIDLVIDLPPANVTSFATGGTGPGAGHIGVSPSGDIVANATDAWTSLDVTYIPDHNDCIEYAALSVVAASGICALPVAATTQGVVMLMEAESLAGTVTGKFAILPPSASNPGATKQCNLTAIKTGVLFKASDAVTSARIKLGLVSAVNQNQLLEAASTFV